ncbi:uncharacterized protein [Narcine bancroftii]|uniref:uncharacterized protein isoform X2 n=1 Tax=Narcine bancroftii TaxID=1343680 RepID=UPI003831849F
MNTFKMPTVWQEDVAKNLSNIFSSNKSPEEGSPAKSEPKTHRPLDNKTTESSANVQVDTQTFSSSANKLLTDLTKVFQVSGDQEKFAPRANEDVAQNADDGILRKLGNFFSRTTILKSTTLPQSKNKSRPGLKTESEHGTHTPNKNDYSKKEPFQEQITHDDEGTDRNTLENSHNESPSREQRHVHSQQDDLNIFDLGPSESKSKEKTINLSSSGHCKESGRSEKELGGSVCTADSITDQKPLQCTSLGSNKKVVDDKTLTKLQTIVDKCQEDNQQILENGAKKSDNSEIGKVASVPPITTYSTYHGARRMKRRQSRNKVFRPQNATISEIDEKNEASLDNQQIRNQVIEETNQNDPTMSGIQSPVVDMMPLTNHLSGKDGARSQVHTVRFPSNEAEIVTDMKTENKTPAQPPSFTGSSGEIELTGSQKKCEHSALTTDTIDSSKKQALKSDPSQSNANGRSIKTDLEEYCGLTVSATTGSNLDDAEKQTKRAEPVGKGLTHGIADNAAALTKTVPVTEPMKVVHMSKEADIPEMLPNENDEHNLPSTRTNKHTTVLDTFEVLSNKMSIPTDDLHEEHKVKDNETGISIGIFASDPKDIIEKPSREHSQPTEKKPEADIELINDEQSSEVLEKLTSKNPSTAKLMNEAKNESKCTSPNTDDKSTVMFEMSQQLKIPGDTVVTSTSEKASRVINSAGVGNSEDTSMIEPQVTTEGNLAQMEKSMCIQKPDQLFKISSEQDNDHTSEPNLCNQTSLPEPHISRGGRLSLANESIFYRYYQESASSLFSPDDRPSFTNNEVIPDSIFKENQFEKQDQINGSDVMKAQKDRSEKAKETSRLHSPAENSVWYRYFEQSSDYLNSQTHLKSWQANEIVHSTKVFGLVTDSADGVIQSTSQECALNDSKEQNKAMAEGIKASDNEDSCVPPSDKPEDKGPSLKISVKGKEIWVQSEADFTREECTEDASHPQPIETNSLKSQKEKAKEIQGNLIFSTDQETPHFQQGATDVKENVTTEDRGSTLISNVNIKNIIEDLDLKENRAVNYNFEEMPKVVKDTAERRSEGGQSKRLEESGNNLMHSPGRYHETLPQITQDKISEYLPSIQNAAKKDSSMMIKSQEESIGSLPILPEDINPIPGHTIENLTNQEASLSKLALSRESVNTALLFKVGEGKANDGQVLIQQPTEGKELKDSIVGAEDSLPGTSSKVANFDMDSTGQELKRKMSELCNIVDPAQSPAKLRSDSEKLTQSNDFQGNLVADFANKVSNSERENKSQTSSDQDESIDQGVKPKKNGGSTASKVKTSSVYPLLDLIKPRNEWQKTMISKVALTDETTEATPQILNIPQLHLLYCRTALASDSAMPPEAKLAVDHVSSPTGVTPHTQHSKITISEENTAVETCSNLETIASLKDYVDSKEDANNLIVNNTTEEIPEELLRTVQVGEEQEKEVIHSEMQQQSENNTKFIAEGESKVLFLDTQGNVSEYIPSVQANEKGGSMARESHGESFKSESLLQMDSTLQATDPKQKLNNQEPSTDLLDLSSTNYIFDITEIVLEADENNTNDGQIHIQQPIKGTELTNTVVNGEDFFPKASLKITQSDNPNTDPMGQKSIGIVSEQYDFIDPAQTLTILTNDSHENSIPDFETSAKHSKNKNKFQSVSVQFRKIEQSQSADQGESSNQNLASEDGTWAVSGIKTSSSSVIPDLVKSVDEMDHRIIQQITLINKEMEANTQILRETKLPLTECDSAIVSDVKSAEDQESSPKAVTQNSNNVVGEEDTTVDTGSDLTTITMVKDAEDVDLKQDTNSLIVNNIAKIIAEEVVRTVPVSGILEKEVMLSGKPKESENNTMFIDKGEIEDSFLKTRGNVSDIPAVLGSNEKDAVIATESPERGFIPRPLLPVDTNRTPKDPDQDLTNQKPITDLLNPTSTTDPLDITESVIKAGEDKVNDGQQPTGRSELRSTVGVGAEDSLPRASSKITTANHDTEPLDNESVGGVSEQSDIIDPVQSIARSAKSTHSNDIEENTLADFEYSDFTNIEEEERWNIPEMQYISDLEREHSTNRWDDDFLEYPDNENGIEPLDSEQEALILDTPLSHCFKRRKYYPFALPPIYEEQDLENETIKVISDMTQFPGSEVEYNINVSVASALKSAPTSLNVTQSENALQEIEDDEENATSPDSIEEVSTSDSNHLEKADKNTQEGREDQNGPSQLQAEICEVDSKTSPKPMPSPTVGSILYSYLQASTDSLKGDKPESSITGAEIPTHLQQKPLEDLNVLNYQLDSKCSVKNKSLKINPRPGKMVIYDQLNFRGNKREIFTDQSDVTCWVFSEGLSLNVIRGCWIIYEKPEFQGQLLVLEEGQMDLNKLWDDDNSCLDSTSSKVVIGSIRRIIKNHCIPEIEIVQEPQQDVIKTYLHKEVACMEEFRPSISSIVVNSGIWLAYKNENFSGPFTLLEAGNSPVPISTEAKSNDIKSLRPLNMGGLKVEHSVSPRIVIFEKEMFNGYFVEICNDVPDLKNLWKDVTDSTALNLSGAGSIRVIGGVWVCYEREFYRGHQYLLEEGEYEEWQAWGGLDNTVQSLRYILADYMKPEIILFEEANLKDGNNILLYRAVPNLESKGYTTVTQSIKVKSGVWVAYHEEHYSGEQYILEKGVYRNQLSWGGSNKPIKSIRPIQLESAGGAEAQFQIQAYNGTDFQGESVEFVTEMPSLPPFKPNSFKVLHGCWLLYDERDYSGYQYVLEEGHYPDLDSLGFLSGRSIKSLKPIINP